MRVCEDIFSFNLLINFFFSILIFSSTSNFPSNREWKCEQTTMAFVFVTEKSCSGLPERRVFRLRSQSAWPPAGILFSPEKRASPTTTDCYFALSYACDESFLWKVGAEERRRRKRCELKLRAWETRTRARRCRSVKWVVGPKAAGSGFVCDIGGSKVLHNKLFYANHLCQWLFARM